MKNSDKAKRAGRSGSTSGSHRHGRSQLAGSPPPAASPSRVVSPSRYAADAGGVQSRSFPVQPISARRFDERAQKSSEWPVAASTKLGLTRSLTGGEASVPFSRTAAQMGKKQMSQALRFASTDRDSFKQKRQARTVAEHRLRHGLDSATSKDMGSSQDPNLQDELTADSPEAQRIYREALRCGKVRPRTLKLMFVGQARAGKTSTLKALTGQGFNPLEPSTHGLATALPLVNTDIQTTGEHNHQNEDFAVQSSFVSQWQVIDRPEHEVHLDELHRGCANYMATKLRSGANWMHGRRSNGGAADLGEVEGLPEEPEPEALLASPMVKMPEDLLTRIMSNDLSDLPDEEPVLLKTWDFGGQREYYVMHHLFITNRGLYLVVTRLDAWIASAEDAECLGEECEPPLEALTFWLSSIHVHAPEALIMIVGTHSDCIAPQLLTEVQSRVEAEILWLLEQVPGVERQVIVNEAHGLCFFPISNAAGSVDPGVCSLRECIDQVACSALSDEGVFSVEIPASWAALRDQLEDAAQGSNGDDGVLPMTATFVLPASKVQEVAADVGILEESEMKECLTFLHSSGSIIFFDEDGLRDYVVLNTQWLSDAMAHLLNCPRIVQGGIAAAKRLRERGELEDDFLRRNLWRAHKFRHHHEVLLRMLYRFDLVIPMAGCAGIPAAEASAHAVQAHVVPCMLPVADAEPESDAALGDAWQSLFLDFHGLLCRLLPTLFPKLVVASHRQGSGTISSVGLHRNRFHSVWKGCRIEMDLMPASRPQVVRIRACPALGTRQWEASELSAELVQQLLKLLSNTLAQHNHLTFTAGILCPHCHAKGRSVAERHHVIDVNEILSEEVVCCRRLSQVVEVPGGTWIGRWRADLLNRGTVVTGAVSPRKMPAAAQDAGSLQPLPKDCVLRLLYASPLWCEGHGGGEIPQLNVQQELSLIIDAAGDIVHHEADIASIATLSRILSTTCPSMQRVILHLALHCSASGREIFLEDEHGGAHRLGLADLEALLGATGAASTLGLVFLNACSSEAAGRLFAAAGTPHVVCCRGSIFDAAARCFTRAFYVALMSGSKTVEQAFEIAKTSVRLAPQVGLRGEADKYILLPEGLTHTEVLGPAAQLTQQGSVSMAFRLLGECVVPPAVEDFCGRACDLWKLMCHLGLSRRVVALCGEPLIGKTAVLAELVRYASCIGRRFARRGLHLSLPMLLEEGIDLSISTVVERLLHRAHAASGGAVQEADISELVFGDFSASTAVRCMRGKLLSTLRTLEAGGQEVLIAIDGCDAELVGAELLDELHKVILEVLLRTERVVFLLVAREASVPALGAHKVVAYRLQGLGAIEAARLFLRRVHRPLTEADVSTSADDSGSPQAPIILTQQNRCMVWSQLAMHPAIAACQGNPGKLQALADQVLPGGPSLWSLAGADGVGVVPSGT